MTNYHTQIPKKALNPFLPKLLHVQKYNQVVSYKTNLYNMKLSHQQRQTK